MIFDTTTNLYMQQGVDFRSFEKLDAHQEISAAGDVKSLNVLFGYLSALYRDDVRTPLEKARAAKKYQSEIEMIQRNLDRKIVSLSFKKETQANERLSILSGGIDSATASTIAAAFKNATHAERSTAMQDKLVVNSLNTMPSIVSGIKEETLNGVNERFIAKNFPQHLAGEQVSANTASGLQFADAVAKRALEIADKICEPLKSSNLANLD